MASERRPDVERDRGKPTRFPPWVRGAVVPALFLVLLLLVRSPAWGEPPVSPPNALSDATLRAVCFVDPEKGWVVGDRGVIWRTVDGGRQWTPQSSGVTCRLDDIGFADRTSGWIVGGWTHAYSHETTGVVLRTLDGGETWVRVPGLMLPSLRKVRFFTPRDGIALGASSALYPAGVFRTSDGGRSWSTMPPGPWSELAAGDFSDTGTGAVAAADGSLSVVSYDRIVPSRTPGVGARRVRAVALRGEYGWLVGDGGLVLRTQTGGANWEVITHPVFGDPGRSIAFDLDAVAMVGDACWIAGSPGSTVFFSPDRGTTWRAYATGRTTPIEGLQFIDANRGWAVGSLGAILGTRDGGRTWWPLRAGGDRVALLGIFSDPAATPWECFAACGGNDGYLAAACYVNRRDLEAGPAHDAPPESRIEEAVVSAGGTAARTAWSFPVRQRGLNPDGSSIASVWDRVNDGDGRADLRAYLVRELRTWRPDVVITEDASPDGKRPLDHEINQALLQAVEGAADSTAYPDLIAAGLATWRVQKVLSRTADGSSTIRIGTSQLAANLGVALDDFAAHARGLMRGERESPPEKWEFRILVNRIPQDAGFHDLLSGVQLPHGGGARREPGSPPVANLQSLGRLVQKRRNVERLVAQATTTGGNPIGWVGQLDDLTNGFPPPIAASVLYQLAMRYEQEGQGALAADTMERLLSSCREQELAEFASMWLVRYHASGEAAWWDRSGTAMETRVVQAGASDAAASDAVAGGQEGRPFGATVAAYGESAGTAAPLDTPLARGRRALEYASLVSRTLPTLHARPELRFAAAGAQRIAGLGREADAFIDQLAASGGDPAWRACAQAEQWLRHGRGMAPKPVAVCPRAADRPHLDGDLSDPAWANSPPLELRSALSDDAAWKSTARFARDDEFLYFAATVAHAPGHTYEPSSARRARDSARDDLDRIELCVDIDRDYASHYRLTVDQRGWAGDRLMGNPRWDPQWYVAHRDDGGRWTIEAAIPFTELAPASPAPRAAWAIQIQRVAPRAGFQSWSTPAAVEVLPQGFGLLVFPE